MKLISIFLNLILMSQTLFAVEQATRFEITPVVGEASADTLPMKNKSDGDTLNILKSPILSLQDFNKAKVIKLKDRSQLSITLSDEASKRLRDYTAAHLGQRLAIILDGQIVMAPVIRAAIQKDLVVGPLTHQEAEDLARSINSVNVKKN